LLVFLPEPPATEIYPLSLHDALPILRVALWDPRQGHFEGYKHAAKAMPPLSRALEKRITEDAKKLCGALGYQMNTVEFAIRNGEPVAIDFMNSAPDLDVSSLGAEHFGWVVEKMADLVIRKALESPSASPRDVVTLFGGLAAP